MVSCHADIFGFICPGFEYLTFPPPPNTMEENRISFSDAGSIKRIYKIRNSCNQLNSVVVLQGGPKHKTQTQSEGRFIVGKQGNGVER